GVLEVLRLLGVETRRSRRPSSNRDQIILGGVDRDPIKSRVKRTIPAKARKRAVGLDERLLRHVLDFTGVAHQPRQQPCQLALVLQNQQLESPLVASLRPLDELLIYFAVTHPRAAPDSNVVVTKPCRVGPAPAGSIAEPYGAFAAARAA